MTSKLTLNIDSDLVDKAKKISKKKGIELSQIIENFLLEFTATPENSIIEKRTPLENLFITKVLRDFDEKEELIKILLDKYK